MEHCRTVDADAHGKIVFGQAVGPLLVDESAVGLEAIETRLALGEVLALQFDNLAEEVDPSSVGSPPCQTKCMVGPGLASMNPAMYALRTSGRIR
jgi:hypothetical protein